MRNETKSRVYRASLHILAGIIIIFLAVFFPYTKHLLLFAVILGITLSLISLVIRIPLLCFFLDTCELKRHKKFPGKSLIFFVAGCLLVLVLFPKDIALASISILTFADPVAHFASKIKNYKQKRRNLPGFMLASLVAILVSSYFIPIKYAIPASILAMLTESFVIKILEDTLDDNFIIPIVAAIVISLAKMIY